MNGTLLLGELACLSSALFWAFAIVLFRPSIERFGAWNVNLVRMTVASLLLGVTVVVTGQAGDMMDAFARGGLLIVVSALLGLTLGDSALFAAVGRLGAYRALLLMTLAPIFTALLAAVFQDERLPYAAWLGGAIILLGVALVVSGPAGPEKGFDRIGTSFGVLAAFGQASGVVTAKAAMGSIAILPASLVRMLVATAGLVFVLAFTGRLPSAARMLYNPAALRAVIPPATLGTYIAFMLMMAGVSWAPAAIAAVLLATTPIFSLFLEAKVHATPITARGLIGTLVAVVGVAVLAIG